MALKVLFIGGTGLISSACSELAIKRGIDLYLLNRGNSSRPVPEGATVLKGDIRNPDSVRRALGDLKFDSVVDWIAFTTEHVAGDVALFEGRTSQYVFISSASAYQKPPARVPVTESTPLRNPFWGYSRAKIACEDLLVEAYRKTGFPVTIVRPSHTYDKTALPFLGGYAIIDRMRRGKKVFVHGDGTTLWVLTHHADFAKGFVPLLGDPRAIGDAFQITSDEALSWNQIYEIFAEAAGATADIVPVPSKTIGKFFPDWEEWMLGDRTHSMIFDNTKIKQFVPDFAATIPLMLGAREVMAWYDADLARCAVDPALDEKIDRMIALQEAVAP
jgi:nucleoside-diphosphate-sugar epimerase